MKLTNIILATFAAIGVNADWCQERWVCCGHSLLNKGDYLADIRYPLQVANEATDEDHTKSSLFYCNGKHNVKTGIDFVKYCDAGKCRNRGVLYGDNCSD
ncbi:hypothetical protein EK21DRAFT_116535 [Setomelanomma holmii]|uniref:Uncharacterized protein n=1 Tax=Setomelanomma holmii TaxID=210430 RepID=A0A9P4H199_9PLEO|nr:hypothetical protein EK21DRAFT_116535 [Setomelanomma holmii]